MSDDLKLKNCIDCPSYLSPAESVNFFGKSVSAPMCAKFGYVLARPGMTPMQASRAGETQAKNCDFFGRYRPSRAPVNPYYVVTLPDPDALTALDNLSQDKIRVTACSMCKNFVSDQVVVEKFGWTAGLCAAKGKLILPNKRTQEARGCDYRAFGATRTSTDGLNLLPALNEISSLSVDLIGKLGRGVERIEPQDYPTDAPVPDEVAKAGIRAWRKIVDPEGSSNSVLLPIYDTNFFSEIEQAKIPKTGDDEHPEDYIDHNGAIYKLAVLWMELEETPAIWGIPGVGKTEVYRHLAWLMGLPFERMSITGSTELDDLAGKMLFDPEQGTHFQYGRLTNAWRKACVVVLDEPNTGPPEVWEFLRPLTDNSKQLVLDMNKGERIRRHEDCYLGMAMNPAWDVKNVGAVPIGDADASRLMHLEFSLPPEVIEREIIKTRVEHDGWLIDSQRLDFLMRVSSSVRELCEADSITISWGVRSNIKVARAMRWFDPLTAYRMAIADMLEPGQQDQLLDQVKAQLSDTFKPVSLVKS